MKRVDVDFHEVRHEHAHVHDRLTNWSRWARERGGSLGVHPMFRHYRPYAYPDAAGGSEPVDSIDAMAVQKAFAYIPERERWALHWCYCHPFISPYRVSRALGVGAADLVALLHAGRTMLQNRLTQMQKVCDTRTQT